MGKAESASGQEAYLPDYIHSLCKRMAAHWNAQHSQWWRRTLAMVPGPKQVSLWAEPESSKKLGDLFILRLWNLDWNLCPWMWVTQLKAIPHGEPASWALGHASSQGCKWHIGLESGWGGNFLSLWWQPQWRGKKILWGFRTLLLPLALSWKLSHLSKHGQSVWGAMQCPSRKLPAIQSCLGCGRIAFRTMKQREQNL